MMNVEGRVEGGVIGSGLRPRPFIIGYSPVDIRPCPTTIHNPTIHHFLPFPRRSLDPSLSPHSANCSIEHLFASRHSLLCVALSGLSRRWITYPGRRLRLTPQHSALGCYICCPWRGERLAVRTLQNRKSLPQPSFPRLSPPCLSSPGFIPLPLLYYNPQHET